MPAARRERRGARASFLAALICGLFVGLSPSDAGAQCVDGSTEVIGWTAGTGAGAGVAAALASAGLLESVDDSRDFSFGLGLGAGIGVSLGLAGVYALVDGTTGCAMANDANPIVWSVPIVTFILGGALPLAVWGASDEIGATEETEQALGRLAAQPGRTLLLRHSWTF